MARKRGRPPDEVSGLTDAELIRRFRALDADGADDEVPTWEASRPAEDPAVVGRFPRYRPVPRRNSETQPLLAEMARRTGAMLQAARLARGLSIADVARATGLNVTVTDVVMTAVEHGSGWCLADPALFERACTEGGLDPDDAGLLGSCWFPLLDHPQCRTIRAVSIDPAWLASNGGAVAELARSIARDRSFDLLPILGDALEEAGCGDPAILGHCRATGVHVLGCWVTDALVMAGRSAS
jgi:hypothetical protein